MFNGIINIYKESGFTSHDVVAKLRGILKQKKIGHTGTLDPAATGVLPVCLGSGTKLCDMLTDKSKEYRAVLRLGITTDTEDMTGEILTQKEVCNSEDEVRNAIMSFIGEYSQIPPMYSALKVNGRKLCDIARKGEVIERNPRQVFIHKITIEKINLPEVTFLVECSKGTYIRSLCRDIGDVLQCGGCMEALVRTRVGIFKIDEAITLKEAEELFAAGSIEDKIVNSDALFNDYPKITVNDRNEKMVINGNAFTYQEIYPSARIYLSDGTFAGIYFYDEEKKCYRPRKMFLNGIY